MVAAFAVSIAAQADVWDVETQNDNSVATQNELVHGSEQMHDLGALARRPSRPGLVPARARGHTRHTKWWSTATPAMWALPLGFSRTDAAGITVSAGFGANRPGHLAIAPNRQQRRAASSIRNGCSWRRPLFAANFAARTTCIGSGFWRRHTRSRASTTRARQITVVIIQNPTSYTIGGTLRFWSAAGVLVGSSAFSLPPKNTLVLPTATVVPGAIGGHRPFPITAATGTSQARRLRWSLRPGSRSTRR